MNRLTLPPPSSDVTLRQLETAKLAAAIVCALVGLCVLLGWWLGIEALTRIRPRLTAMNPTTATCFVLTGSALLLHALKRRRAVIAMATAVGVVALLKIVDLWSGATPVDTLLFPMQLFSPAHGPNRMAPNTAVAFLLAAFRSSHRSARIVALPMSRKSAPLGCCSSPSSR